MFEIEKAIPIPPSGATENKYPVKEMEVGDSFFVPGFNGNSVRVTCGIKAKLLGYKITVRFVEKDGTKGHRVWRIS